MILTFENSIRGGISSVMGDIYVESDVNEKIINIDANILYGHSTSQPLPIDENEMWHGRPDLYMNWLDEMLKTPDVSDIGYLIEVDLRYPDSIKEKTQNFPFWLETKVIHKNKYNDYLKKTMPKTYTKAKTLIYD